MKRFLHVGLSVFSAAILSGTAFAQLTATADTSGSTMTSQPKLKQVPLFSRDLEIEFALNGAPKHLRDDATVLVLTPTGWITAKQGKNAFTCLVSREAGDVFPVCWDREGVKTVMSVSMDDSVMRLKGMSSAEVSRQIADGFKTGKYRAPTRTGVSYMLSPMRYKINEQGKIVRTAPMPHVMFYAPNLTDEDIGGARGTQIFINTVGPQGMIIAPVGREEKAAIIEESASLVKRVEQELGYTDPNAH